MLADNIRSLHNCDYQESRSLQNNYRPQLFGLACADNLHAKTLCLSTLHKIPSKTMFNYYRQGVSNHIVVNANSPSALIEVSVDIQIARYKKTSKQLIIA